MSSRYVFETLQAYLKANWTETRVIDSLNLFSGSSVASDPPTEWVSIMPEAASERQASLGAPKDNRWREEGSVSLFAFVPSGTGIGRALELAEMLRDLFRAKQIDDGHGGSTVVMRQVDPPDTALPSSVDASSGVWFAFGVTAAYYCDFCRLT